MYRNHVQKSCTQIMYTNHVHKSCTQIMYTYHVHESTPKTSKIHTHGSDEEVHGLIIHTGAVKYFVISHEHLVIVKALVEPQSLTWVIYFSSSV